MFDIENARKEGYSDFDIAKHLSKKNNFDYTGAVKEGHQDRDIVQHLLERENFATISKPEPATPQLEPTLEPKSYTARQVPGAMVSNIPSSAYKFGAAFVNPETYKGLAKLGDKLLSEDVDTRLKTVKEVAGGLWDVFVERYGGWEKAKRTVAEDPVGLLADVSVFLTGGGTAVSKIGPIAKIGEKIATVGKAIEPLSAAGSMVGKTLGPMVKGTSAGVLGVTTGAGKTVVEKAMEGSRPFKEALRGRIEGEEIVQKAKVGVEAIKEQRGEIYRTRLVGVQQATNISMNMAPVNGAFDDVLKSFKIEKVIDPNTGVTIDLDFHRSAIFNNAKAQSDFKSILDTLGNAKSDPGFFTTPEGFDILKRQLQDMYSESGQGRAAVEKMSSVVRKQLIDKVPGYREMVGDYEKTTKLVGEIERSLSLKEKNSIDTAVRKLNSAMKEDDNFRRSLVAEVEKATGEDIGAMISGRMMSTLMPTSWMGRKFGIATVFGAILGRPEILPMLIAASPRLTGETLYLLAKGKQIAGRTHVTDPELRQIIYQLQREEKNGKVKR